MSEITNFYKVGLLHNGDYRSAPNGDLALIKGKLNVRQRLFHRLITVQGSLAHRPKFGVGIKQYQNVTLTIDVQKKIALEMKSQFEQDEAVESFVSVKFQNLQSGSFLLSYKVNLVGGESLTATENPFGEISI